MRELYPAGILETRVIREKQESTGVGGNPTVFPSALTSWLCARTSLLQKKNLKAFQPHTLKRGFEFYSSIRGFPDSSVGEESACKAEYPASIPGLEEPRKKGKATHPSILA